MDVSIDLALEGFGEALAASLFPAAHLTPTAVHVNSEALRLEGLLLGLKKVAFVAAVERRPRSLRIHRFELQGTLGAGAIALEILRGRIAALDQRWGRFRVRGDPDGDGLVLAWTAARRAPRRHR